MTWSPRNRTDEDGNKIDSDDEDDDKNNDDDKKEQKKEDDEDDIIDAGRTQNIYPSHRSSSSLGRFVLNPESGTLQYSQEVFVIISDNIAKTHTHVENAHFPTSCIIRAWEAQGCRPSAFQVLMIH